MKWWAEWFYTSDAWRTTRAKYMQSKQNICERCGDPAKICHHRVWLTPDNIHDTSMSLNYDNLEALCQACHNKEHHSNNAAEGCTLCYQYDEDGNIIPTPPLKNASVGRQ